MRQKKQKNQFHNLYQSLWLSLTPGKLFLVNSKFQLKIGTTKWQTLFYFFCHRLKLTEKWHNKLAGKYFFMVF